MSAFRRDYEGITGRVSSHYDMRNWSEKLGETGMYNCLDTWRVRDWGSVTTLLATIKDRGERLMMVKENKEMKAIKSGIDFKINFFYRVEDHDSTLLNLVTTQWGRKTELD